MLTLVLALVALAVSLWNLHWIDTDELGSTFTMSLPELRDAFNAVDDAGGEALSAPSMGYLNAHGLVLGALIVLAGLAAVRAVPWKAVTAAAVAGFAWHAWFVVELVDEVDGEWGTLGVGGWVAPVALAAVAVAALLATDPDVARLHGTGVAEHGLARPTPPV